MAKLRLGLDGYDLVGDLVLAGYTTLDPAGHYVNVIFTDRRFGSMTFGMMALQKNKISTLSYLKKLKDNILNATRNIR
jgi:hypothetical protein